MQSKNSIAMLTSFNEVNLAEVVAMRKELGESVREGQRHQARLHELLRQGGLRSAQAPSDHQRLVDGNDSSITATGHLGRRVAPRRAWSRRCCATRSDELRRRREGHRSLRQEGTRRQARRSRTCRAAPSPSPTAAPSARCSPRRSSIRRRAPSSACTRSRSARSSRTARSDRRADDVRRAISYDHRIIDGKDAVLFLVDIKNQLENPQPDAAWNVMSVCIRRIAVEVRRIDSKLLRALLNIHVDTMDPGVSPGDV